MKKLAIIILCIALLVGCAYAEETVRTGQMVLEGTSEEFSETLYRSDEGYELWYPSEYLKAGEAYGHDCFGPVDEGEESAVYFMIVPSQADPEEAEELLGEAVGGFGPEADIGEIQMTNTLDGALMGRVQAVEDKTVYRYYLIADDQNMLLITACFPVEALEGLGVRFDRMAALISFVTPAPDAVYEGEEYSIGYFSEQLEPAQVYGYDAFAPVGSGEEKTAYFMIVKADAVPEQADGLLSEAVGGYGAEYEISRGEEEVLASGLTMNWIQAGLDGRIDRYYLIRGEEAIYCITSSFSEADGSDYGMLFDAMARSFEVQGSATAN